MSIDHQVLGAAGRDNALWVRVDSGQARHRLLFDCGDCLADLSRSEIRRIDHLFFSHLHMDHVAGFDALFRCTYDRDAKPNVVWGPPDTSTILRHRLRGFWWNLHAELPGTWRIHDVYTDHLRSCRFMTGEAFEIRHQEATTAVVGRRILDRPGFTVEALHLDHRGPCLAYLVREKARINVDPGRLAAVGLPPGPWIQQLKRPDDPASRVEIDGQAHDLRQLRAQLLVETPGESIAYLTDFLLDEATRSRLASWLAGCDTVVCEAQYRHSDLELARRNFHATTTQVARMARRAEISRLILFHLSERYEVEEWREMLAECRQIFPHTSFPDHWVL